jgi:hypothetical protein
MKYLIYSIAISASVLVSGCNYRTDGSEDSGAKIICVKAPIGLVTPDDVYESKLGQPIVVRCPPDMVPKVIVPNVSGTDGSGKPTTPGTPPTKPTTPGTPTTPETQNNNVELSEANPGGATAATKTPTGIEGSRAGYGDGAVAVQDGRTIRSDHASGLVKEIFGDVVTNR